MAVNQKELLKRTFEQSLNLSNSVSRIVSGGMRWVSGLIYESVNLIYEINGEQFSITDGTQVTLDAAPTTGTDQRFDIIYGDDAGVLGIEKGTAGDPATVPTIDVTLKIQLTLALLDTSATEPDGVSIRTAYTENAGQPNEFDATENTSAARIEVNNTTDPITGTTSIRCTNVLK